MFSIPCWRRGGALFLFSWKALRLWRSFCIGFRAAWESGWAITGCSPIGDTRRPSGLNIFLPFAPRWRSEGGPIFWVATHRIHHQIFRQRRRSAFADRRQVVGAHGLDPDGQVHASRHFHAGALCSRPGQGQVSRVDYEIPLRAHDRARTCDSRHRRNSICACGESSSAPCWAFIPPGWSIPPRIRGALGGF